MAEEAYLIFRHIYIENWQIKYCCFYFLGWGLRVIYHSYIFDKLRPPLGFLYSQIEIETFFYPSLL